MREQEEQQGEEVAEDRRRRRPGRMWEGEAGVEDLLLLLLPAGAALGAVVRTCGPPYDLVAEVVHQLRALREEVGAEEEQKSPLPVLMAAGEELKARKVQQEEGAHPDETVVQAAAEVAFERMLDLCSALAARPSWLSAEQGQLLCLALLSARQSP